MNTLLLDQTNWDLVADASGNIAMATPPYALAQDVASACKLFSGELWYDTAQGIPYFTEILGMSPPVEIIREFMVRQALTVPGVTAATVIIDSLSDRGITGQIQFTDTTGSVQNVGF